MSPAQHLALPQGSRVAIVTDSASSLTPEMGASYGIHIVPIYVMFGTQTYRDGVDLDADLFYRMLSGSKQLPTTSQPTAADFVKAYTALSKQAEAIVSIHASGRMSATVDSAQAARAQLPDVPIHVIDSRLIAVAQGLLVLTAARAAASGQNGEEVARFTEEMISRIHIICAMETMEYLHKGGRIGGAAALLGSALRIKPILHMADGQIEPLEKPRTRKRAIDRVLDLMGERVGSSKTVHAIVMHCNVPDEAQALVERVAARFPCQELLTMEAGPIIGTHAGPGTLGVVFYAESTA